MDSHLDEWLKPRRILITGASGPLGTRLRQRLRGRVAELQLLSRTPPAAAQPGESWWPGDLLNAESLRGIGAEIDTLLHLASYSPAPADPDPENHPEHLRVGNIGTTHLLTALRNSPLQYAVLASSVRALAPAPHRTRYGEAKVQAERLLLTHAQERQLHAAALYFPACYGEPGVGSLAAMAAAIQRGYFPPIPEFNNPRSLLHLEDAVTALLYAASHPAAAGQGWIVTDGHPRTPHQLYRLMLAANGRNPPRWQLPPALLQLLANLGTLGERLLHRPLPFNQKRLAQLRDSYHFDSTPFTHATGFSPAYCVEKEILGSRF